MIAGFHARPLRDDVHVKKDPRGERIVHGIVIPERDWRAETEPDRGEVVAVGPGRWAEPSLNFPAGRRIPPPVQVGERVIFSKWQNEFRLEDGSHLCVVPCAELLAVEET